MREITIQLIVETLNYRCFLGSNNWFYSNGFFESEEGHFVSFSEAQKLL